MSDEQINIEINGIPLQAKPGSMVIQVADEAGIRIPRFCYHPKLSVAANCRMCLVEVEKAPKPLPACATPVMEGMKVFTKSPKALSAQQATMEFLLINHPLDCPICDQGGECELQDVAMGYGGDVSRYSENKRVVMDENLGSLIATDMTRCIHCTRCVRFGQELAGLRELGATGRGEHTRIGTYIEEAVDSEMSGNIIDLCPVGALTAKPSRYKARAWEIMQHPTIAAHDCMGSNIDMHTFRGKVMRVVPRDQEAINECWLSDRDRFAYEGLNSEARLTSPMIKVDGLWQTTDWDVALQQAAKHLQSAAEDSCFLVSPNSTVEEMSLVRQLASGLGSTNLDHRLRQTDFRETNLPAFPALGRSIESLEKLDSALLIGSNVRKEQPIAAHRLRKASLKGARLAFVNTREFDFNFRVQEQLAVSPSAMVGVLGGIVKSLLDISGNAAPSHLQHLLNNVESNDTRMSIAEMLNAGEQTAVILGPQVAMMNELTEIRALAQCIAEISNASFGYLTDGCNTSGAWLTGMLPFNEQTESMSVGKHADAMLSDSMKACVLMGVEPEFDCANPSQALQSLQSSEAVIALTPFVTSTMKEYADVLLPITPYSETSGSFINCEGKVQSFKGVTTAAGESRPGWKVLRVMGNLLDLQNFNYLSSEEILAQEMDRIGTVEANNFVQASQTINLPEATSEIIRVSAVATYHEDGIVRRAQSLQKTHDAQDIQARINSGLARQLNISDGGHIMVKQQNQDFRFTVTIDDGVAEHCVWIPAATKESARLGAMFASISVEAG